MLSSIGETVLHVACGLTGHGLLWLVGRRRQFEGNDQWATVVGVLFWVAVGAVVFFLLSR
jgi:hypothetical protein